MIRIGRIALLKEAAIVEYKTWHSTVFPELLELISQAGIRNYSVFLSDRILFSYLETDDWAASADYLSHQSVCVAWQRLMAPLMDAEDPLSPWKVIDEIFHLP